MSESSEWNWEHIVKSRGSKYSIFSFGKLYVEKLDKIKKKFFELKVHTDIAWHKLTLEIKYLFLQLMVCILSNLDTCIDKELLQRKLDQFEESDTCETKDSKS